MCSRLGSCWFGWGLIAFLSFFAIFASASLVCSPPHVCYTWISLPLLSLHAPYAAQSLGQWNPCSGLVWIFCGGSSVSLCFSQCFKLIWHSGWSLWGWLHHLSEGLHTSAMTPPPCDPSPIAADVDANKVEEVAGVDLFCCMVFKHPCSPLLRSRKFHGSV